MVSESKVEDWSVTLYWVEWPLMLKYMLDSPFYGIPTIISKDPDGRIYTWPLSFRIERK